MIVPIGLRLEHPAHGVENLVAVCARQAIRQLHRGHAQGVDMRIEARYTVSWIFNGDTWGRSGIRRAIGIGGIIPNCGIKLLCGTVDLRFAPTPDAVKDHAHAHATPDDETQRILEHA